MYAARSRLGPAGVGVAAGVTTSVTMGVTMGPGVTTLGGAALPCASLW